MEKTIKNKLLNEIANQIQQSIERRKKEITQTTQEATWVGGCIYGLQQARELLNAWKEE